MFAMISRLRYVLIFLIIIIIGGGCTPREPASDTPLQSNVLPIDELTIADLQDGYRSRSFTIRQVTQAYLDRIDAIDKNGPSLNSVIQVNPDAMRIAGALDSVSDADKLKMPLYGVPVLLKDNIDTHDNMATTAGSRALKESHPLQDSYVARKLRAAGAVILGKANLSEWANFRGQLSSSGWSGLGGQTKNPYDITRNPCGSSSGSAVAVAANLTLLAIGTETNGSIVCPSHATGIVGIKPTVGLISRSGIIPISFTQDTPGPMARTVRDAAIALGALVGVDSADHKTWSSPGKFYTDYTPFLKVDGLQGKRIGFVKEAIGQNFKVDSLMYAAIRMLKEKGATVVEIDKVPGDVGKQSFEVMLYEFKAGLNAYFTSLGPDAPVKSLAELIAFNKGDSVELQYFDQYSLELAEKKGDLNSADYKLALAALVKGSRDEGIDKVMNEYKLDALVAPTGGPAWVTDLTNGDSFQLGSSSPAARAGYPNITVPMGFVAELPVGISFFGRAWSEPVLLEIAYSYETATKHRRAPKITVPQ